MLRIDRRPKEATPQHLKAIFEKGEFSEEATCKDYLQVRHEERRAIDTELEKVIKQLPRSTSKPNKRGGKK